MAGFTSEVSVVWRTEVTRYRFVRDRVQGLPNLDVLVAEWGVYIRQKRQNGNVSLGTHTLSQ